MGQTSLDEARADAYRAVVYCRVSTDDKDQTNATQERVCREWCEAQGMEVLDVYSDEMTGTSIERPGWGMMTARILTRKDVDYVVAYDQSRITRGDDMDEIREMFKPARCRIRLVRLDLDVETLPGRIAEGVMSAVNQEENRIRNERTRLGLATRKLEGQHVGHPSAFCFAEDVEKKPRGYVGKDTVVVPEELIFDYARKGYSAGYVAKHFLQISKSAFVAEMRLRDPSDPSSRAKGLVDRWSVYKRLYHEAVGDADPPDGDDDGGREGCGSQRVGDDGETEVAKGGVGAESQKVPFATPPTLCDRGGCRWAANPAGSTSTSTPHGCSTR